MADGEAHGGAGMDAGGEAAPSWAELYAKANKGQADAANPRTHAWVSANAGSGKTKVLTDRVARLLLAGASPETMLCLTYTKAAASEMLTRLYSRLGNWSVMENEALAGELNKIEGEAAGKPRSDAELRRARALFARALETPGGLRIETIHAFCTRLLKRFPLEAGVPQGFSAMEDADSAALWERAAEAALLAAPEGCEHLQRVGLACGGNTAIEALNAVKHFDVRERMRDAWGAAGGDPAEARAQLLEVHGLPRDADALALLKAAVFSPEQIAAAQNALAPLDSNGQRKHLKAAYALAASGRFEQGWESLRKAVFTQKGTFQQAIVTAGAGEQALTLFRTHKQMEKGGSLGTVVASVEELDAKLRAIEAAEHSASLLTLAMPAVDHYQREKEQRVALDFDDLVDRSAALLDEGRNQMALWVLFKLDGGIDHILVDEAQDTSPLQWKLIRALRQEMESGEGAEPRTEAGATAGAPGKSFFAVGDKKQSIYRFQGADTAHFDAQAEAFQASLGPLGGVMPEMEMSFRSAPEILRFADAVWNGEGRDRTTHTAFREDKAHRGAVELWPICPHGEAPDTDNWELPVDHVSAAKAPKRLARAVARRIKAMCAAECIHDEETGALRLVEPGDVLILVRGRQALFHDLIAALKSEGLPVAGQDKFKLTSHEAVQDCLNLMRFALLPGDDLVLAEILRGPFFGLLDDDAHLFPLAHDRGRETLWSRLQASAHPLHRKAASVLESLHALRGEAPFEFLAHVLERPSFDGCTGWDRLRARMGDRMRDAVEELCNKALAHDAQDPVSLLGFVSRLATDETEVKRELSERGEAVRVMTIHGAKGLEAPVVVLPETTKSPGGNKSESLLDHEKGSAMLLWSRKSETETGLSAELKKAAKQAAAEEDWRLIYVAVTRARDRLVLAGHWTGNSKQGFAEDCWHQRFEAAMAELKADAAPWDWSELLEDVPAAEPDADADAQGEDGDAPQGPRAYRFGTVQTLADLAAAQSGNAAGPAGPGADPDDDAPPPWLAELASTEAAGPVFLAPASLLQDRGAVSQPFSEARMTGLRRGHLIHMLLQRLPGIPPEDRHNQAYAMLAFHTDASEARDNGEMVETAMRVLEHPQFADVFGPGSRGEVPVTGRGPDLPPGHVVNGTVDRLVVTPERVLAVDFKTDRPPPGDASGVEPAYLAQMAAYRSVLRAAYPGRPVGCALVWTDGPVLMPLSDAAMSEALTSAVSALPGAAPHA